MADRVYGVCRTMMTGVLKAFSTWSVEGRESVPPKGPLIVVANHLSNIDPPLLACSIPRRLYFLAKGEVFKPGVATFLRAYGAYPLNRGGGDVKALRWAQRMLEQDNVLTIFPEAHRNPKAGLQRPVPGIAALALQTQAPILPVGITGTGHLGPLWRIAFPTGHINIRIGDPFTLPVIEGRLNRSQLESLADMVMSRIALLLPPEYQGVYRIVGTEA